MNPPVPAWRGVNTINPGPVPVNSALDDLDEVKYYEQILAVEKISNLQDFLKPAVQLLAAIHYNDKYEKQLILMIENNAHSDTIGLSNKQIG